MRTTFCLDNTTKVPLETPNQECNDDFEVILSRAGFIWHRIRLRSVSYGINEVQSLLVM
jgi:hypothetical protein